MFKFDIKENSENFVSFFLYIVTLKSFEKSKKSPKNFIKFLCVRVCLGNCWVLACVWVFYEKTFCYYNKFATKFIQISIHPTSVNIVSIFRILHTIDCEDKHILNIRRAK